MIRFSDDADQKNDADKGDDGQRRVVICSAN